MNSKYVQNYWIEYFEETGVYHLLFNLTERWLTYHQYNDEMYEFGEIDNKGDEKSHEDWVSSVQEVPEFLPEGKTYIPTVIQNKEQISFYFIPIESVRNGKMIISS